MLAEMNELMQTAPLAKHSIAGAVLALGLIPGAVSLKCKGFPGGASGQEPVRQCRRLNEMRVRSLGRDDLLEEGVVTHSGILAWTIPMDRGAW